VAAVSIPERVARDVYRESGASTWGVSLEAFAARLTVSASARFKADTAAPSAADVESFLRGLHLTDLALACACGAGHDGAWEHFVREMRPALYAAARSIAPPDAARDLADSLYARLLGVDARGERRASLFDYYHGRARLSTWLRTVLAQRHIDDLRQSARTVSLESLDVPDRAAESAPIDPRASERTAHVQQALGETIAALDVRDRLRLRLYYGQGLKLAAIGRLTGESEATVSRKLDRARQAIRLGVETRLRAAPGMTSEAVAACLSDAAGSAELDVSPLLAADDG
jgi:RNA polymerase sigma-70 factor (ECF subfamily)